MQSLILSALLCTLANSPKAPATPPGWQPVQQNRSARPRATQPARAGHALATGPARSNAYSYTGYRRYRRYRPTPRRRYRRSRRYRSYRARRFRNNFLKKGGLTLNLHGGWHELAHPEGPFDHLRGRGNFGYTFGWNFSPYVHWGVTLNAGFFAQKDGKLGAVKGLGQLNVTSDLTFRLFKPSDRRYVVPFLQLGLGVAVLTGSVTKETTAVDCDGEETVTEESKSITLSRGGIFQVGGGVEFYLTRYLSLGFRALYRLQAMSGLRCADGPNAVCNPATDRNQFNIHGVVTDASLTVHFWSI